MSNSLRYTVFFFLLLSSILLSVLVPGGPIETRDFSHISSVVLVGFNIFLTSLSIGSLILLYFIWLRRRWAFGAAAACGAAYFSVYALDLAHWFPVSPDTMPPTLFAIEAIGTIISVPLTILSIIGMSNKGKLASRQHGDNLSDVLSISDIQVNRRNKLIALVVATIAVVISISIIIFATKAAMGL